MNEASVELEGNVLTHTSLHCVFTPPPPLLLLLLLLLLLPSLPFCTGPSYYLLLLFSELYKRPLRLWPFDGVERRVCGTSQTKKKKKLKRDEK